MYKVYGISIKRMLKMLIQDILEQYSDKAGDANERETTTRR